MKNCPSGPCAYCTMVAPELAGCGVELMLVIVSVWIPWAAASPWVAIWIVPGNNITVLMDVG